MTSEIEQSLDRLLFTTEALENVSRDPLGPSFSALLDERSSQLRLLQTLAEATGLNSHQLDRLKRVASLGDGIRTPLGVQRALLKERLDELRAAQRSHRALNPPKQTRGRQLNVSG